MFDIAWSEMLLVAVIAIVVIGPKDLPAALRQAGKWMGAVRRMASEFQGHVNEAMKEAELDGLRKELTELKQTARGIGNPMHTIRDEMRGAIEGKATPAAGVAAAGVTLSKNGDTPALQHAPVETPPAVSVGDPTPRPSDMPLPAVPGMPAHFTTDAELAALDAGPDKGATASAPSSSEIKP